MEQKTDQEREIYEEMIAMLADQFYHQPGTNITINRLVLADMLAKQTIHGIQLGKDTAVEYIESAFSESRPKTELNISELFREARNA
jgi:hypothetical protein